MTRIKNFILKFTLARVIFLFALTLYIFVLAGVFDPPDLSYLDGSSINVRGKVSSMVSSINKRGEMQLLVTLSGVSVCDENDSDLQGRVQLYLSPEDVTPLMGETIEARGKVSIPKKNTNPGGFDAASYYASKGISFNLYSGKILKRGEYFDPYTQFLFEFRNKAGLVMDKVCREDSPSLRAILLGDKYLLDEEQKDLYQAGGISHILAISGLHISFLGAGLYRFLKKICVPRLPAGTLSSFVIVSYVLMVGVSPSSFRAAFMFLLSILADIIGKTYDMMTAMAISALLLILENPLVMKQSGFLLSYGAIIGIGYLYPMLSEEWDGRLIKPFLAGISITSITLPVLLMNYYSFPVFSFLLNLLVIPLMGLVMSCGLLAVGLGFTGALVPVGIVVFIPARLILFLFRWLCELAVSLPGGRWITGEPDVMWVTLYYILILLIWFMGRYRNSASLLFVLACGVSILTAPARSYEGDYITMLDVGQGDGIVIKDGKNRAILIDGGSTSVDEVSDKVLIPYLRSQRIPVIDYAIISHMDADHINGMEELITEGEREGIRIKNLVVQNLVSEDEDYRRIVEEARTEGINVYRMGAGDRISWGDYSFDCLSPTKGAPYSDRNDASIVLKMTYSGKDFWGDEDRDFTALFTGDLDKEAELEFARRYSSMVEEPGFGRGDLVKGMSAAEYIEGGNNMGMNGSKNNSGRLNSNVNHDGILKSDLLKVGHHGSKYGCHQEFIDLVRPELSIISCGEKNRYGHPSPETISRLINSGSRVLTTPQSGAIRITYN